MKTKRRAFISIATLCFVLGLSVLIYSRALASDKCYILGHAWCAAEQLCSPHCTSGGNCGGSKVSAESREDACVEVTTNGNRVCRDNTTLPKDRKCYTQWTCIATTNVCPTHPGHYLCQQQDSTMYVHKVYPKEVQDPCPPPQ